LNTKHFIFHILVHIVTSMYISCKCWLNILTSFFPYKIWPLSVNMVDLATVTVENFQ
jgi:hypothetical protein